MSRIYFHSRTEDVEVSGPERGWAGNLTQALAMSVLRLDDRQAIPPWLARLLKNRPEGGIHRRDEAITEVMLRVYADSYVLELPDGRSQNFWEIQLNTAVVLGTAPIQFLARMHGQCEVHMWVEGQHRGWLHGVIAMGRAQKILRADMGWEKVMDFLLKSKTEPVVLSYSVCDQFPNEGVADMSSEDFDHLPDDDARWSAAFGQLIKKEGLKLEPENIGQLFAPQITMFDLHEHFMALPEEQRK